MIDALLYCLIPALVFAYCAYYINKHSEHFRFRLGFTENRRPHKANSFLESLITQPDNTRVWGVDTSRWDGNVNFSVTRERGASFAIIKAMEGTVPTAYWLENRRRAVAAGLIVGDYHWLHQNSKVSCKAQALAVWTRIKNEPRQIPLCVDFESTKWNGMQANPNYADLDIFVTEYTRLSGHKPLLYSSPGYMKAQGTMPVSLKNKFRGLWIANYGVTRPSVPAGFATWLFWQFSAEGDAEVITPNDAGKKEVDLIYWWDDLEELQYFAGVDGDPDQTPLPEPEEGITMQGTVTTFTNIRAGNNRATQDLGDLLAGDRVVHSGRIPGTDGLTYCELTDATRNGVPVKLTDGRDLKDLVQPVYAYAVNIRDDATPPPSGALRLVLESSELKVVIRDEATGKRYGVTVQVAEGVEFVEL